MANGENIEAVTDFIFLDLKVTEDGYCSHEIKRRLLFGRKVMTNLDSIFKSINSSALSLLHSPTLTSIHDHRKDHSLDYMDFCWQSNVSAFHHLSRLVIAFLTRSSRLSISWLQSAPAVTLEPEKRESVTVSMVSPFICHEVMGRGAMISVF